MCAPSDPSVQAWRPWFDEAGVDFGDPSRDTDRMLAWIAEESCGLPSSLGALYEVGIFQLDLEDGPAWGGSIETLHTNFSVSASSQKQARPLTDDEKRLQVSSGLAYVKHARSLALGHLSAHGMTWSDDDTWCLTKLHHGLPVLQSAFFNACANELGSGIAWSDFRAWVEGRTVSQNQQIYSGIAHYYKNGSLAWLFDNAEKVGYLDGPDGGGSTSGLVVLVAILVALFALTR